MVIMNCNKRFSGKENVNEKGNYHHSWRCWGCTSRLLGNGDACFHRTCAIGIWQMKPGRGVKVKSKKRGGLSKVEKKVAQ